MASSLSFSWPSNPAILQWITQYAGTTPNQRGAISCGDFQSSDIAFLGPAVDDAGYYFEASEELSYTKSAADIYLNRPWPTRILFLPYFLPYDFPLKNANALKYFALSLSSSFRHVR